MELPFQPDRTAFPALWNGVGTQSGEAVEQEHIVFPPVSL